MDQIALLVQGIPKTSTVRNNKRSVPISPDGGGPSTKKSKITEENTESWQTVGRKINIAPRRTTNAGEGTLQRRKDVLVELGAGAEKKDIFAENLRKSFGQNASVRSVEPMTTLEIKDLDSLTTEEEVKTVLGEALNEAEFAYGVYITRENSPNQKMAIFSVPEKKAVILLKKTQIIIGLVSCRISRKAMVTRCFRCFGYGHRQMDCKGPNRKGMKLCIKCGEEGHIKRDCKNSPRCCLCLEQKLGEDKVNHVPGSGTCQVFRWELDKVKKKGPN